MGSIDKLFREPGVWDKSIYWADNIKPDAIWHGVFPTMVLELKNSKGIGGDSILQAICDYTKILPHERLTAFQRNSNFPIILIGISGSRLDVSCAVCVGSFYTSNLYTLDVSSGFHCSESIVRLARVFKALSLCYSDLKTYYTGVTPTKDTMLSYTYPNPTSTSGVPLPLLTYRRFMARTEQPTSALPDLGNTTTSMYIATLNDNEVVVKFTARYNRDARVLLSSAGFAPKLPFCERVVGGLYMVVMGRVDVDGKSIWQLRVDKTDISAVVPKKVKEAVLLLHGKGIVFGGVRDANILVQSDGSAEDRVFLVDFDWAGKDREIRSATLNMDNDWEDSVYPNALMRKVHGLWHLDRLKRLCRNDV